MTKRKKEEIIEIYKSSEGAKSMEKPSTSTATTLAPPNTTSVRAGPD